MGCSFLTIIAYLTIFLVVFWSEFVLLRVSNLNEVWDHFGTRTPYRFKYNKQDDGIAYPDCQERKIWGLIRHGTRFPSKKDINEMKQVLPVLAHKIITGHQGGKGNLTAEHIESIKQWSTKLNENEEKLLAEEGKEEMVLLAERIKKRFPGALADHYNNITFFFRHSATERAQQSAKYFTIGLFDRKQASDVWYPSAKSTENVLRFYKHCNRWQKEVKKNDATFQQKKLYGESSEMKKSLERISKRLGLENYISLDDASLVYRVCGYETAWTKGRLSPWCYALDASDAEVFEYYYDLEHYWQDGYGYELSYKQACMTVKDMFDSFSEDKKPQSSFLFSHSGTLLKTLSHLGLYKPSTDLTANSRQADRPWKATEIDCFGSNLIFVLYRCKHGDYVLSLHQERPVVLPPCTDPLCPLTLLRDHYSDTINKCNFKEMCSIDSFQFS